MIIFGDNITDVIWEAPKNSSCIPKNLELSDNGELELKCDNNEIAWTADSVKGTFINYGFLKKKQIFYR